MKSWSLSCFYRENVRLDLATERQQQQPRLQIPVATTLLLVKLPSQYAPVQTVAVAVHIIARVSVTSLRMDLVAAFHRVFVYANDVGQLRSFAPAEEPQEALPLMLMVYQEPPEPSLCSRLSKKGRSAMQQEARDGRDTARSALYVLCPFVVVDLCRACQQVGFCRMNRSKFGARQPLTSS